ncbi:hypothetical protein PybrP1_000077 [[Pythium] brassicae (nom. inval.)]|nr:hypothetical protein PybrP1_000077 [[Pythium] brassicae (nom. inval.)]
MQRLYYGKLHWLWTLAFLLQFAHADTVLLPSSPSSAIGCSGNSEYYDETVLGCRRCTFALRWMTARALADH